LKKYGEKAPQIVASFNGHYVVRGGNTQALEGEPPKGYIVVIGFDSVEKAREWYDSPAYAAIRTFRQSSTKSRIFIAEGIARSDTGGTTPGWSATPSLRIISG
jgi:uncharacterized protein (DUF1330 family)